MPDPHLRIARPSNHLAETAAMYFQGLDLQVIGSFEDHAGFDGVMVGRSGMSYHLEFTRQRRYHEENAPSKETLPVFYIPDRETWNAACSRMETAGFKRVNSINPYWDQHGRTFEDPDGYRVVFQNASWET